MTEQTINTQKTPGIVIFVAVLNFIGSFFLFLLSALCAAVLLFGNMLGAYEFVTKQITQVYPQPGLSLGINVVFGILLAACAGLAFFYLFIGAGLLRGNKLAWYFQVALSILGLLGFPLGTVLNAVILIFFFQPALRSYFRV